MKNYLPLIILNKCFPMCEDSSGSPWWWFRRSGLHGKCMKTSFIVGSHKLVSDFPMHFSICKGSSNFSTKRTCAGKWGLFFPHAFQWSLCGFGNKEKLNEVPSPLVDVPRQREWSSTSLSRSHGISRYWKFSRYSYRPLVWNFSMEIFFLMSLNWNRLVGLGKMSWMWVTGVGSVWVNPQLCYLTHFSNSLGGWALTHRHLKSTRRIFTWTNPFALLYFSIDMDGDFIKYAKR